MNDERWKNEMRNNENGSLIAYTNSKKKKNLAGSKHYFPRCASKCASVRHATLEEERRIPITDQHVDDLAVKESPSCHRCHCLPRVEMTIKFGML